MAVFVGQQRKEMAQDMLFVALASLGTVYLLRLAMRFAWAIWVVFLRPAKDLTAYGAWAVVTGATDGIGRSFCNQLAQMGINVVLVSRSETKLQEISKEIQNAYGVETKYVKMDFAADNLEEGLSELLKIVDGLEIGILINNVGVSYPYARFLHEVEAELMNNLLNVNVRATTRLTQLLLPGMMKRRKGAIVNIGSGSGSILPSDPLYSVYAASKGYVEVLSRSLYVEYRHSGIDVQCQVPLYVKTKLAKIRKASITVPTSEAYVKSALRWIGYEPLTTPYWAHYFIWCLLSSLPPFIVDAVRLRSSIDVRRRGLAKDSARKTKAN